MDRRRVLHGGLSAVALGVVRVPQVRYQDDRWSRFDLTGRQPDANGLVLPEGFVSRVVATSGQAIDGTDLTWHTFPDGGATFEVDEGYVYVSNSEVPGNAGGVGAIRFDRHGAIIDAYPILEGTSVNCAGGATPWGSWLSCEEHEAGRVWECDPTKPGQGEVRPAMGTFTHEAVAVDAGAQRLYLTEDLPDGRFYRFTPDSYPDLSDGTLEVAAVADGAVRWLPVPDRLATSAPIRTQVPESTAFNGGEGIVVHDGSVFFTTKGDDHVWRFDPAEGTLDIVYDGSGRLRGVDNITTTPEGDLLVAEDGDDLELVLVDQSGGVQPVARCTDNPESELCGPAFDPSGTRLYFSSQRGGADGIGRTYEITGPFGPPQSGGEEAPWVAPTLGGAGVLAAAAAVWRLRTRRSTT
ncbi:MAG TPA: alkaline phosphatase PhoX [Acidimicrobiales bacterium]